MDKLKPCPVCGNHILSFITGIAVPKFAVLCEECGEETDFFDAKDKAVAAWNRRVENGTGKTV